MASARPSVAVVGSYGIGLWINTPRLPSKGETVLGSGFETGNGGKGSNQAIAVARLGTPCALLACVGDDAYGKEAFELWKREGVDASHVLVTSDGPTMAGFIIIDPDGDNCIITDPGANSLLLPEHVFSFEPVIASSRVLLTQMEIPLPTVVAALEVGRRSGVTTILNPAPAQPLPDEALACVDVLTPNRTEARMLAGLAVDDPRPIQDVALRLLHLGVKRVVVTLGAEGAAIVTSDGMEVCPGVRVPVVDTTGAGDGFNAALAAAIAEGRDLREAVVRANHAGALVVTGKAVIPALPSHAQLEASLQSIPLG
jgi:ribokinase